jgi:acetylornithine deacetylase
MTETRAILERLIAFPTLSRTPNAELIGHAADLLRAAGARVAVIEATGGHGRNLYASLGPEGPGGVMLSGHTDVVPVEGQDWTTPPFRLAERDGRLFGRGTADMKGFCAAAIAAMRRAGGRRLRAPLHLALSADEEIGCIGVRSLVEMLEAAPERPAFCIVGEPTSMAVATGHKGKVALEAACHGVEAHSALAPTALNALHLACDLVAAIRAMQDRLAATGARDGDYDVPYTTLHVGRIAGGVALNIVPGRAEVAFEIRHLAEDDPGALLAELRAEAERIAAATGRPEAAIRIAERYAYPGLATPPGAGVVDFVKGLTGANGTVKVAFGTEGGLFAARLGVPVVVCGPGSMAQGHRPDEYVTVEQLARCDAMLDALIDRLEAGL